MIHCPECNSRTEAADSRDHDFNTTKRRRMCPQCGWRGNSVEVLLAPEFEGKHTDRVAYQLTRTAQGNSPPLVIARQLRGFAEALEQQETP